MLEKLWSVLFGPTSENSTDGKEDTMSTVQFKMHSEHAGGSVMVWGVDELEN